jgi:hypothetical protein
LHSPKKKRVKMSDRVFYVGAQTQEKPPRFSGFVPAKFLTLNGKPVVDPAPGGSQVGYIYADGSDKYKTRGEIANPNNYLIVPANYTEEQAQAFAAEIARTMDLGPIGQILALRRMKNSFWPNGPQDLQRHPQWGIPENSVVPAFIGSASYHLGSVTRWAGLSKKLSEIGGGIPHWFSRPSVESEFRGLSQRNYEDISKGFSDADVARKAASGMNDFGYNPQTQYSPGQIGDGNGLGVGDWRFPFAGVDSSNPTQPVPPLQTDSKPAPRLVRVNSNTSPTAVAVPVAPSDNRNSFDNRFGKWGSSLTASRPLTAPDRPDSFSNRFGNWGSVPAGDFGNPASPVLRALEKYRRSAAPDGPASTSAQGARPATPTLPPDMAAKDAVRILGKFVGGRLITSAEAASPSGPMLPGPAAPNSPGEESAFGDRSENAPGAPRPDPYPRLLRVSSAFPDITPRNPDQPVPPPERVPALGIFSGKPMSSSPLPLGGLPYNSCVRQRRLVQSSSRPCRPESDAACAAVRRQQTGAIPEPEDRRPTARFRI